MKNFIKGKSFLFATFSIWHAGKRMPTNGNLEPFRDYLLSKKVSKLTILDQPVPSSQFVMPRIEVYSKEVNNSKAIVLKSSWWLYLLKPFLGLFNVHGTRIIFKIRDFCSVVDVGVRSNIKFDYLVGVECINCLAGLVLRKLGIVKKVIYYVLDFSSTRYSSNFFNKLYIFLDQFCVMHADYVWDVSPEFQRNRIFRGLKVYDPERFIRVPIGLYEYQIIKSKTDKNNFYSLSFVGTLGEENGPDIAIKTVARLIKKYPKICLHIVGGGDQNISRLKRLAKILKVMNNVKFYGYVANIRKMVSIISKTRIALAPYLKIPNSIRYFADSGKIRTYAGAGIPVITTDVPPLGRELADCGGALVVKDNPDGFARAVKILFTNKVRYEKMKKRVMDFATNNTWTKEFDKAFGLMFKYYG